MRENYLEAAVAIAREAGKVLREELERPPDIAYKGDFDLVTQADRRSEAVIVSRLPADKLELRRKISRLSR